MTDKCGYSGCMSLVVVISGTCEGVGRATAREFAKRGAKVALLECDRARLDGGMAEVKAAGGDAPAIPTEIADYAEVDSAAAAVEETFGPIDVWVSFNLDGRYATRAALAHMRTRDHGVVVQVESASSGTAPDGSGVTVPALGPHSRVYLTTVRMLDDSAAFTEIAARTVVFASENPEHRQYRVGPSRLADRFFDGFDRQELRLSAVTWLALRVRSWAWKLEQRLKP